MQDSCTIISACCSSESKKSETCFPLNLGAPGAPGVGIGMPSVALRFISEEDELRDDGIEVVLSVGLMSRGDREKNLK